jgi:hypothetical protein
MSTFPVSFQRMECRTHPPSTGKPGMRLKTPRRIFVNARYERTGTTGDGLPRIEKQHFVAEGTNQYTRQRPDERHRKFDASCLRIPLNIGNAAKDE